MAQPIRVKTISQVHQLSGLPMPAHPLISVIDYAAVNEEPKNEMSVVMDFYSISIKRGVDKMHYGQQTYDFDGGIMALMAPGQILKSVEHTAIGERFGWIMLVHPDFLWNTPLASKIKQYEYFNYATNEALFLSDKEEGVINSIIDNIKSEYNSTIDKFSQDVIIAQLEVMFTYVQRFYERQFITRKITNNKILTRLEGALDDYFKNEELLSRGLPTVQYIADTLNISPKYLSSMLKQLTGLSTQQQIHEKLIAKAKEKLSITDLSVSEIAYELGFEHSQSFSKLFKAKTKQSPLEFRASFN